MSKQLREYLKAEISVMYNIEIGAEDQVEKFQLEAEKQWKKLSNKERNYLNNRNDDYDNVLQLIDEFEKFCIDNNDPCANKYKPQTITI